MNLPNSRLPIQYVIILTIFIGSCVLTYLLRDDTANLESPHARSNESKSLSALHHDRLFGGDGSEESLYERRLRIDESSLGDAESVKEFLRDHRDGNHHYLFDEVFEAFAQADLESAFDLAREFEGLEAQYWISVALKSAFQQDADLALRLLAKVNHLDLSRAESFGDIEEMPEDYADQISKLPASFYREALLHRVAESWHASDPKAAMKWASTLPVGCQKEAFKGLFASWAKDGFDEESQTFFDREIHGQLRIEIAREVSEVIAKTGVDDAFAWIDQHLSGSGKVDVAGEMVRKLAATAPAETAVIVHDLGRGEVRKHAGVYLMDEWSQRDASAAAQWVLGLSETEYPERDTWLNELSKTWYRKDSEAVMEYILNDEDVSVEFVETVAEMRWREDQTSAMEWINTLEEPYRSSATRRIEDYKAIDPVTRDLFEQFGY